MLDQGLGSWPARRARIARHRTALVHEGRSWTYGELAERVDRLADFAQLEIKDEVRPLILKENAVRMLGLGGS